MKYSVYMQGPEQRQVPSQYPALDSPWELIGEVERKEKPADLEWSEVVFALTGKSIAQEGDRGTWYKVIPEYD